LLCGLRDYFDPVGTAEELLVEEIAVSYWKERRAHLYENRQIQDQIRTATRGDLLKEVDYDGGLADLLVSALGDTRQLLTSLQGLEYLLGMLGEIREEVDNAGEASGDSLNRLSRFLGGDWKSVVGKSEMLAEMDREKHRLEGFKKMIKQREEEDRTARVHRALLVGPETMEQLLRY